MASDARPIEAVVFDMDGVLIDSEPIWRAVEREVFAGVGIRVTDEDLVQTMGVRIGDVVELWHRRRPWDDPEPEVVARRIVEGVSAAIEREGALNEGAVQALRYLTNLGLRLALASSSPMPLIRSVLSVGGLADRFDVVVSGEDEALGKPDPAVYLSAARRMRVDPTRCLAVEDSESGVRSAKAAGMTCIAIAQAPPAPRIDGADLVLGSLDQLDDRVWAATGTVPTGDDASG
ncbi:MAG: hexitol phosphatase HxpB [Gemmatimonadota bacterium]